MKITNKNLDFFLIARSGQCFRMHASDALISLRTGSRFLEIQRNGPEELDLSCSEDEFPFWAHYLDLNGPYTKAIRQIPKDDPYLLSCASCCRGLRILRQDPFETLISFIISQRKAIPAIQSCVEKLCRLCGEKDEKGYAFPTPQAIAACSLEELATCSLGYRAPGVGIKVASCVMLFGYHRLSCAPVDVWIQRVIDTHYHGINPFPSLGEYAGLYQQYMFCHARLFEG